MKVQVNGEARDIPADTTIRALIELEGLAGGPVAVEQNGEIVKRKDHATTAIVEDDVIEIVHFVGGG